MAKLTFVPELYDLCQARVQAVQAELAAATAKLQALESQKKATDNQPTVTRQNVVPNSATNVVPLVIQVSPAYTTSCSKPINTRPIELCGAVPPQTLYTSLSPRSLTASIAYSQVLLANLTLCMQCVAGRSTL